MGYRAGEIKKQAGKRADSLRWFPCGWSFFTSKQKKHENEHEHKMQGGRRKRAAECKSRLASCRLQAVGCVERSSLRVVACGDRFSDGGMNGEWRAAQRVGWPRGKCRGLQLSAQGRGRGRSIGRLTAGD